MRRLWLALVFLAIAAGCAVNPVTGRSELHLISEKEEIDMGRKNYGPGQQQSGGQYILDPALTAYVQGVGQRLAKVSDRPQLPYEFVVLNDSTPNAWAMPGGKLAINRGLLYELGSEAELAAVLGHEIVHAAGRHGARGVENNLLLSAGAAVLSAATSDSKYASVIDAAAGIGAGLLGMKYGRDLELEADHYGMVYMQRAGYDPQAAVKLQETFVRLANNKERNWLEGLFASHPPSQERVDENRKFAATLKGNYFSGEKEYQARMAPLLKTREAYKQHDEGEKALRKGDAEKALKLADAAIRIEPREAIFYGLRGDARAKLGKAREAEADYTEAVQRNPDFYEFYLGRGKLRQQRGETALAVQDFARANRLLPTAEAHYALGRIRQQQGQEDEAIAHYRLAAQSGGAEGRSAAVSLARLELPRAPGRYLATAFEPRGGQLVLVVRNNAAVPVRGIGIVVSHAARGSETLRIAGLRAGESTRVSLPWPADGARVAARVTAASIAD